MDSSVNDILTYVSMGVAVLSCAYSGIVHFLHRKNSTTSDINTTIKFNSLDSNITAIKELFQKLAKTKLFSEAEDIENRVQDIATHDYDKIKEEVATLVRHDGKFLAPSARSTIMTKVSNILHLSQAVENHIQTVGPNSRASLAAPKIVYEIAPKTKLSLQPKV